jgi:hypothetical protein
MSTEMELDLTKSECHPHIRFVSTDSPFPSQTLKRISLFFGIGQLKKKQKAKPKRIIYIRPQRVQSLLNLLNKIRTGDEMAADRRRHINQHQARNQILRKFEAKRGYKSMLTAMLAGCGRRRSRTLSKPLTSNGKREKNYHCRRNGAAVSSGQAI